MQTWALSSRHFKIPSTRPDIHVTCSQIVSVLRESNGGDRARVAWEVCHIGAFLQIPDLDLGVSCSSAKDEAVRMELSTGESCRGQTEMLHRELRHTEIATQYPHMNLPQPALSSVTLVRTRPVWISEKAQYCTETESVRTTEASCHEAVDQISVS